jgi:hypothetical protein
MKRRERFDAIEWKAERQRQLLEEYGGMSPDEARTAQRRAIESDPALADFLRHVQIVPDRAASSSR